MGRWGHAMLPSDKTLSPWPVPLLAWPHYRLYPSSRVGGQGVAFPSGWGWRCRDLRVGRRLGVPGELPWDHEVVTSRRGGECIEIPGHFPERHVVQETGVCAQANRRKCCV